MTLLILNLTLWSWIMAETPSGELEITFLDVGQGDAILIEGPTGNQVLIDGGPSRKVLSSLSQELPWFDRSLDLLIATHPDQDHISGLIDVLGRYQVQALLEPNTSEQKDLYEKLKKEIKNEEAQEIKAREGILIKLGGGARLEILSAESGPSSNDSSIIALLSYSQATALFTGDASRALENEMMKRWGKKLDVDLLKLGHHGSKTSSSKGFLVTTSPDYAIISVAKDNRYGLPSPEVLTLLEDLRITTFRTDEEGNISFTSRGSTFQIKNP